MATRRNVLLITVDQWRGDCLGVARHPVVRTPNLDRLASEGVLFRRHYAQAAPCGPSRASLHTGQYLMKHRSGLNGTPLDARFTNLALEARAAGYDPVLFGYTDASPDPRTLAPDDPRLSSYEGVLPGYRAVVDLPEHLRAWGVWLRTQGYDVPDDVREMYTPVSDARGAPVAYAAEHTEAAFLTGAVLDHVAGTSEPWFVHAAYIRPHPPFVAPEPYASMYDPADVPEPVRAETFEAEGAVHPVLAGAVAIPGVRLGDDLDELRQTRGDLLRDDERGRRAARSSVRRLAGARRVGRHPRGAHLGSRRAARRPLAHGEARVVRAELPHPVHRARSRRAATRTAVSSPIASPRTST